MPSWRELVSKLGFLSWLNGLLESQEEYGTPSVTLTGQPVRSKGKKFSTVIRVFVRFLKA